MLSNKIYIKAFSLIELLIAVVFVAIILIIALPSWQAIISKNHALSYANKILTILQFTRATAIKLGEPVKLSHNGSWQNGSTVVIVKNGKILRTLPPIFAKDKLDWHGGDIIFSAEGFANGRQGSFYYCPNGYSQYALAIILSSTGRVRISNTTYDGKKIPCNF